MCVDKITTQKLDSSCLRWAELLCNCQSVRLGLEPLCDSWPDFSWS